LPLTLRRSRGNAIPNHQEDPEIRSMFEESLMHEGAVSRMESRLYDRPEGLANEGSGATRGGSEEDPSC
jgi:hypothetical protein